MESDRRFRLWAEIVGHAAGRTIGLAHVCAAAVSMTGVDGAAVTVTLTSGTRETLYSSDGLATEIDELTLMLGEGPDVDISAGAPVLVADLSADEYVKRWPLFVPAAVSAGAYALFALPLRLGGANMGTMLLSRAEPGKLDRGQLADALGLADCALTMLLDAGREDGSSPDDSWFEQAGLQYSAVHQATGMVTVQLGVTAAVALVRLRAYAYAHERRVSEVARDIVARRLRLDGNED